MNRTKWGVVYADRTFISNGRGGMRWTYDRAEANELAGPTGDVVDAEWFSEHWREWSPKQGLTGITPADPAKEESNG